MTEQPAASAVDPRVAGQGHLRARFIAGGVDFNIVNDVLGKVTKWEEWSPAWKTVADQHFARGEAALAQGDRVSALDAFLLAAPIYHFGRYLSADDAANYFPMNARSAESYRAALALMEPPGESLEVPFEGKTLKCWLRRPRAVDRPPVVLLLPGLDANKEELHGLGEAVVRRGMAALAIDGPGQGENEQTWAMRPDSESYISKVIDYLPADLGPVGVMGVSLGGYWAPRAAAHDERIRACVPVCGPYDWSRSWPTLVPLQKNVFKNKVRCTLEAAPARAAEFTLAGLASKIKCPMLVIHAALDTIIRPSEGEQLAAEAPNAELVIYPDANHVCHNRHFLMRPRATDWLARQLGAGT